LTPNPKPPREVRGSGPPESRRGYGSGSLYQRAGNWYGRWYSNGQRVKRKLGPIRPAGTRDGLTRAQAEREMRRIMAAEELLPTLAERVTVGEAGERLVSHLEALGRRPTTLAAYRAALRTHLAPELGALPLSRVEPEDVERFIGSQRRRGVAPKTTLNALGLLHSVFEFGLRRGWCRRNPCKLVDKPRVEPSSEIRFLDQEELEALLRATADPTDRVLFLTAALTGLRQGELLALRWRDIDWSACRVRVRRNYVRGHWGAPKTRRGSRAIPLADRVAVELERHFQRSAYKADDDLVFCHPALGTVLDHSDLVRRFKRALRAAGVREVRFHDLRHTFGTRMAAAGVPLRTLQEWLGHRDFTTTLVYADYQPAAAEAELVERAFGTPGADRGPIWGPILSEIAPTRDEVNQLDMGDVS
jgi:integrase